MTLIRYRRSFARWKVIIWLTAARVASRSIRVALFG
jgi:hypothetical protein